MKIKFKLDIDAIKERYGAVIENGFLKIPDKNIAIHQNEHGKFVLLPIKGENVRGEYPVYLKDADNKNDGSTTINVVYL